MNTIIIKIANSALCNFFLKIKKHLFNIGWLFAGKIFRMALSMAVGIWVARYLGVENYGILCYCFAFALLFRPLAMFQLEGICVREIVKNPEAKDKILGSAFILSIFAGLISVFVLINLITIIRPGEPVYCAIVTITGFGLIFLSFEVFDYWFQANVNSKPVVIARTIVLTITSLVKAAGILMKVSIVFFAWINLVEFLMMGAALVVAYKLSGSKIIKLRFDYKWFKKLFIDALPLALSGMAATIYLRIDKIMIGEILGAHDVGIYSAATRLAEAWYFLPICIMTSIYPAVIKTLEKSPDETAIKMQQIYRMMVLLGYFVGIITTIFAGPVVTLLFGDEYRQASGILTLYIWAGVFVNIAMGKAAWLKAMNYTGIQFVSTLTGAIINITLNIFLINRFGITGAVWATIISYSVEAYFILFVFPSTRKQAEMITKAVFWPVIRLKDLY